MINRGRASTLPRMSRTENKRIYAIGDIHGCLDDLVEIQARIADDLRTRPHPDPVTIYVGDFMDRGPDSRGVIANLIDQKASAADTRFLLGNHDTMLTDFLTDPFGLATPVLHWLDPRLGGAETLRSYGFDPDAEDIHAQVKHAFPEDHLDFLTSLDLWHQIGGYVFVHAGIRPGVTLEKQKVQDLIWIREPFLSHKDDYGFTVVHGHSPVRQVENHGNRIDIDTGAVFGRELSCLVLEDDTQNLLSADGLTPCPVLPRLDG